MTITADQFKKFKLNQIEFERLNKLYDALIVVNDLVQGYSNESITDTTYFTNGTFSGDLADDASNMAEIVYLKMNATMEENKRIYKQMTK